MSELYYFGCRGDLGHYMWESNNGVVSIFRYGYGRLPGRLPGRLFSPSVLDGTFCPPDKTSEGQYMVSIVPPWKIISWWDFSVDTRLGSHSTFIGEGFVDADHMLSEARKLFADVFVRQKKEIVPMVDIIFTF